MLQNRAHGEVRMDPSETIKVDSPTFGWGCSKWARFSRNLYRTSTDDRFTSGDCKTFCFPIMKCAKCTVSKQQALRLGSTLTSLSFVFEHENRQRCVRDLQSKFGVVYLKFFLGYGSLMVREGKFDCESESPCVGEGYVLSGRFKFWYISSMWTRPHHGERKRFKAPVTATHHILPPKQ